MRDIEITCDRRTLDIDGRLHVTDCVLTAAQCNEYLGQEVPNAEALGLKPDKIYMLYRTPDALKASVSLFENIPVLLDHVAVSAADPKTQMICGSVSNARWVEAGGQIIGDLALWTSEAIELVESNQKRDLSVGYHYVCRVGAGEAPDGTKFDAQMTDIRPNHISLVVEGRVQGAMVADAALDIEITCDSRGNIRYRRPRRRRPIAADCEVVIDAAAVISGYDRLPAR